MTPERLDEIEARAKAAINAIRNAELLVLVRTDIPDLIAEVRRWQHDYAKIQAIAEEQGAALNSLVDIEEECVRLRAALTAAPQPEPVEPPDRFVENWDEWFEKHNASWLAAKIATAVRAENEACAACVEQVAGLRFKQGELSENGQAVLNYIIPHIAQSIRARQEGK